MEVKVASSWRPVDLYVSRVGPMARGKPYEKRFQNPGQGCPIRARLGVTNLLLGCDSSHGRPVFVGADPTPRVGHVTRFSVLFHEGVLREAARTGWAEYVSTSEESIIAFHPSLLPAYILVRESPLPVAVGEVVGAITDAGFSDTDDDVVRNRARRAVSRLVRSRVFSRKVIDAYDGCCAMCGIDWGLVQAAHIYPAPAPGSRDSAWNGLALCGNHHLLFDDHKIFIHPTTRTVTLHDGLRAQTTRAGEAFLDGTLATLREPSHASYRPRRSMFDRRYEWFENAYTWAS